MSYTRAVEDGSYMYPEVDKAGIRVMFFPYEEIDFIPDIVLDVLLYRMSIREIDQRRQHGEYLNTLLHQNIKVLPKDKDFFKWKESM